MTWNAHFAKAGEFVYDSPHQPPEDTRNALEPWLNAIVQSEHLSVLTGNGLTTAVAFGVGENAPSMAVPELKIKYFQNVLEDATASAAALGRGRPNVEDFLRSAMALVSGLRLTRDPKLADWEDAIYHTLRGLVESILTTEAGIAKAHVEQSDAYFETLDLLGAFILAFASRPASRERLRLFTTNYDRVIERGCDHIGLHVLDRFVGILEPAYRSSRLDLDIHYNPPGIRGEPRYLEGVVRFTKLHGSIDWSFTGNRLRRIPLKFGAKTVPLDAGAAWDSVIVYPNAAKDAETLEYPYAELFRDFSAAICRPNCTLVTYGYGYGDDHINRVIRDMLSIQSTHLVVITYGGEERIQTFCAQAGRPNQLTILSGNHFGNLGTLVRTYLPRPALDVLSARRTELLSHRGTLARTAEGNEPVVLEPQPEGR